MKKISKERRERDVLRNILFRRSYVKFRDKGPKNRGKGPETLRWKRNIQWIEMQQSCGNLNLERSKKRHVTIHLPRDLNFSNEHERTTINFNTIRMLVTEPQNASNSLQLKNIDFAEVRNLSTSASIVLAAELSRWNQRVKNRLTPRLETWDPKIITQLYQFGFFGLLFGERANPDSSFKFDDSDLKFTPYIQGKHGEKEHRRELKAQIEDLIGDEVDKWIILSTGLSEAITNVSHHAYPESSKIQEEDRNWFMGGSFDKKEETLRIVFFDQGIGIPKSLPASKVWESVLSFMSKVGIPYADRKKDATLLKAAVEYERTSTNDLDRGKGLQDLLDFVRERKNGYLSILSGKGLFKYSIENGTEAKKVETFSQPIKGTLIIWKVRLKKA